MKLRPLRDQIILHPLSWRPSAVIEVAGDKRRTLRGVVAWVGPGERVKKYWRDSRGQKCKMGETGRVIPTEVRPGDVVEIGGLELDGYRFQTTYLDGQQYVIIQQQDVAFVVEEPSEADLMVAVRYREMGWPANKTVAA
jgi:hypothetical protein